MKNFEKYKDELTKIATNVTKPKSDIKDDNLAAKNDNVENMCKFVNLLNSTMIQTYDVFKAYEMIEIQLPIDFANMCVDDFYPQLDELAVSYQSIGFKMYVNDLKIYRTRTNLL